MRYIFIFNGRPDKAHIIETINKQIDESGLDAIRYITTEMGDATRYVNVYCDLNPKDEVCFVACGGAGLTNEVVSGIVGRENKYFAILCFDGTNDFLKVFPTRNFKTLDCLLKGQIMELDILKVNDNYALNCASLGMDAMACALAQIYSAAGQDDPYNRGIRSAFLFHRYHNVKITIDGKPLRMRYIQNGQVSNGRYTGGEYLCAPHALIDDGLMEVCLFKLMPGFIFLLILNFFRRGEHLTNRFCKKFLYSTRAKSLQMRSKDLIYVGLDGEYIATSYLNIDLLPKAVKFILPCRPDGTK